MAVKMNKIKVSSIKNSETLELQKINHEGQMVLTINQICQVYDIKKHNLRNRFYMNKESFVEGKHYFKTGALNINIFTQKGVRRLTSLIGGYQALKIYKKLEENYFNQEEEKVDNVQSKELTIVEANENSGLSIFENEDFGKIRIVKVNNKPYAVGIDVAKILEYVRPNEAVSAHCRATVSYRIIDSLGRKQQTNIIPEGDIYRLIVKAADQSKNQKIKIKAEKFESWIFDEILPQIRQTGQYVNKNITTPSSTTNNQMAYLTECTLKYVQKVESIDNKLDKMQDSFDRMFNGLAHIYRNLNKENILVKTSQPIINNKVVKTNLKNIIKKYSEIKKTEEKDIYKLLYSTAKKNIPDCDMYAYAKKSGDKTMLNAIDKMGKLEEVYSLAQELFTV